MSVKELKKTEAYDEIGGAIRVGDLMRVQDFKPPFVIVRVTGIDLKPAEGDPYIEIVAEPWRLNAKPGLLHTGLVRVVDPEKERLAQELLDRAMEPEQAKRREVVKIDEQGKRVSA